MGYAWFPEDRLDRGVELATVCADDGGWWLKGFFK